VLLERADAKELEQHRLPRTSGSVSRRIVLAVEAALLPALGLERHKLTARRARPACGLESDAPTDDREHGTLKPPDVADDPFTGCLSTSKVLRFAHGSSRAEVS